MDKRKAALWALALIIGAGLVYGGYATWEDWTAFARVMFGAM